MKKITKNFKFKMSVTFFKSVAPLTKKKFTRIEYFYFMRWAPSPPEAFVKPALAFKFYI